jgi:hypothetical protein
MGHGALALTGSKTLDRPRQRALGIQCLCHGIGQHHRSGRFIGLQSALQAGDLIAQGEPPLLEPTHHQLVSRCRLVCAVDQRIEIAVFHAQLNQAPLRGVVIRFQR